MQRDELVRILTSANLPLDKWGTGKAKTLEHLLQEINSGEIQLISTEKGLLRVVSVAMVDVFYQDGSGRSMRLQEDRQVFAGSRERRRNLDSSLAEKILPGENSEMAARRAVAEELQIRDDFGLVPNRNFVKGPTESESYPGLQTRYDMFCFFLHIPTRHFKPEGYVEIMPDKTTYFVWQKQ